jgi:hypothetical protein
MLIPINADKAARGHHETVHFPLPRRDLCRLGLHPRNLRPSDLAYCRLPIFRETDAQ